MISNKHTPALRMFTSTISFDQSSQAAAPGSRPLTFWILKLKTLSNAPIFRQASSSLQSLMTRKSMSRVYTTMSEIASDSTCRRIRLTIIRMEQPTRVLQSEAMNSPQTPPEDTVVTVLAGSPLRTPQQTMQDGTPFFQPRARKLQNPSHILLNTVSTARCPLDYSGAVHSLPAELLIKIFKDVPGPVMDVDITMWQSSCQKTSDLIPLTLVCRQWRDVVVSAPELRLSICGRISWLLLSQSRDPAQTFVTSWKRIPPVKLLHSDAVSRIRELHWTLNLDYSMPAHVLFEKHVPLLEFFTLRRGGSDSLEFPSGRMFKGATPRLKYMCIDGVRWLPCNLNKFPALTHISLSRIRYEPPESMLKDLLVLLKNTPNLEDLVLEECSFPEGYVPARAIPLRRLRILTVSDSWGPCDVINLLSHLTLDCNVAITVNISTPPFFALAPRLLRWMADIVGTPTKLSVVEIPFNPSITLSVEGPSCRMRYLIRHDRDFKRAEFYCMLFEELPVSNLRSVCLDYGNFSDMAVECSRAALQSPFPNLETLVIDGITLAGSLNLRHLANTNVPVHTFFDSDLVAIRQPVVLDRAAFPKLTTLRVICGSAVWDQFWEIKPEDLAVIKEMRDQGGVVFKHLIIESPTSREEAARGLSKEVAALFESIEFESPGVPCVEVTYACKKPWTVKWPTW
ncbi:hypothetical protein A0H81_07322 [Grifola frondosa]|uniref:F-box domain-containing protein n=1 Tax=Grifola frondosa TaxID=5627 RepID=A0A1C7MDZ4_GRIFR|nr:hypothetical protein A0H81_07322 [Grifola frondosa]